MPKTQGAPAPASAHADTQTPEVTANAAACDPIAARPLIAGDRVSSLYAGRAGRVVKVYQDGSACIAWDDGEPQEAGLGHERMPRTLLALASLPGTDAPEVAAVAAQATAAPRRRVTARTKFFSYNPDGASLFAVVGGAPSDEALDVASCLLSSALDVIERAAMDTDRADIHGAAYLVEMAKGVVNAALLAMSRESSHV
jgi:hypothetical protein